MADGKKRPAPPEDSFSNRTQQRCSLLNYPDTGHRNMQKAIAGVIVVLGMFLTPGSSPNHPNLLGLGAFLRGLQGGSLIFAV